MTKVNRGAVLLFISIISISAFAGNWTQWRGSNRDLLALDEAVKGSWPDGGPKQLWQIDIDCDGYSSPLVVDGRIYITGSTGPKNERRGWIFCLNAKDGSVIWKTEYGPEWGTNFERARTTPNYIDGKLYLISGQCHVVCLNASDGKVLWDVDAIKQFGGDNIKFGISECPLIYDGKIICTPGGKTPVVALSIKDGSTVWKCDGPNELSAYCNPALLEINGIKQVVTSLATHTVGVDADSGKLIWKYKTLTSKPISPNTPILCGKNRIYVSQGYNFGSEVFEVNGSDVKRVWFHKKCANHFQGAALYKNRIFSSGGGKFYCFDPETGDEVYTVDEAKKTSFCILKDGMMITYDERGGTVLLVKVDEKGYQLKGSFKITYGNDQHWSSPVVANGVLYLRHGKGVGAFSVGR